MIYKRKKIVCFGGGNALTKALFPDIKKQNYLITLVNSMVDNGGSTGELRKKLGILPPGDIRRHLLALSEAPAWKKELWKTRIGGKKYKGGHRGHNFANLFIAALECSLKEYSKVLEVLHKFMEVKDHQALPATISKAHLCAVLNDGNIIVGEDKIDTLFYRSSSLLVKEIFLQPKVKAYSPVIEAIRKAKALIIGPGDLYSSVLACFLPLGIKETIAESKAKKIYICNLMTKKGETNNFSVSDFVKEVEKYIGTSLDFVVYNKKVPTQKRIERFRKENPSVLAPVKEEKRLNRKKFIGADLILEKGPIIHNSQKVVKIITSLI